MFSPETYVNIGAAYKRDTQYRIFVNRSLQFDKIKFIGFDMDYTLAEYISPDYEIMVFECLKEALLSMGYPVELRDITYDATFPMRGLWFDKEYGIHLKMDHYGNILAATFGFKKLNNKGIHLLYPNKFLHLDKSRVYVMNTLFNLPEIFMLAAVVQLFADNKMYEKTPTGVKTNKVFMSYRSVFQDVRAAMDRVHLEGKMKEETVNHMEKYIHKDKRLITLLEKLRSNGTKVFLLTNSDYAYTDKILTFLLEDVGSTTKWLSYFDYIVVDARKPLFFKEGTVIRIVDKVTGKLALGHHIGPLTPGQVYSGGSCETFSQLIGAVGKDVLYVGDHIHGDILKSKKIVGWRTFLVVPELAHEIYVWKKERNLFLSLEDLAINLAESYRHLDIDCQVPPDVSNIRKNILSISKKMESCYGPLGSLLRSGSQLTFFSAQMMRYADLYSFSCLNILYYPLSYMFRAPSMLMPHESTVSHTSPSAYEWSMMMPSLTRRSRSLEYDETTTSTAMLNGDDQTNGPAQHNASK